MFTVDELLSKINQRKALGHFVSKPYGKGKDNIPLSDLEEYWNLNSAKIIEEIKKLKFNLGIVRLKEVINGKGKNRHIAIYNTVDRFVLRLLYQKLVRYISPMFLANSYAYQENKGILDAVKKCQQYINEGYTYVLEIDIEGFFDNIDLIKLENLLYEIIKDECVRKLIHDTLYCRVDIDGKVENKRKGIIQGSPTSAIYSNLYLHGLDVLLEDRGCKWVRYADDLNVYTKSIEEANELYTVIVNYLKDKLELKVNAKKSGIYQSDNRRYLGYDFIRTNNKIEIRKHEYKKRSTYYNWSQSSLSKIDNQYHLVGSGVINKKDYTLIFENSEKKYYIPVETTEQLNIYSNVTVAYDVIQVLSDKKIRLAYVDKFGNPLGYFTPTNNTKSSVTMLNQAVFYKDIKRRLEVARSIELAELHNILSNLKYYKNKDGKITEEELKEFEKFGQKMNKVNNIDDLMLVEARARQTYYQLFNKILDDEEFYFYKRTKQPPLDYINSLISFGNTLLYNELLRIISKTALDIKIGVIHATNRRSHSLNLDFADLFKPLIVDRVIFTLINRKQICSNDFEKEENGGIYISGIGKQTFITEFEKKMQTKVKINGKKLTYRQLLEREVDNFVNYINDNQKYKPYRYY